MQGVYDRSCNEVHLFQRGDRRKRLDANIISLLDADTLVEIVGKSGEENNISFVKFVEVHILRLLIT